MLQRRDFAWDLIRNMFTAPAVVDVIQQLFLGFTQIKFGKFRTVQNLIQNIGDRFVADKLEMLIQRKYRIS